MKVCGTLYFYPSLRWPALRNRRTLDNGVLGIVAQRRRVEQRHECLDILAGNPARSQLFDEFTDDGITDQQGVLAGQHCTMPRPRASPRLAAHDPAPAVAAPNR